MNYPEAIQFLYNLQVFGTKLGLENTYRLAKLAGNPQEKLRFIHVAGTNGKGSTCAMLESIYRHAGLKVGLFTSPHLVAFGERIQINRELISEEEIIRLVEEMKALLQEFPADEHPTFFEVVTIMALSYFARQKCDVVIWETGLGGRLDATNIVTPLVSVITNIQFDHQKWLGDTLAKIAFEKAGIIKPRVPVITAVDDPEALRILFKTAQEKAAPFSLITWAQTEFHPMQGLTLPLLGEHQRLNAATAVHAVMAARSCIPVSDETIRKGLSGVKWPGRLQLVERKNGQKVLLDGAHNIGSAEALKTALNTYFATRRPTLVMGILSDKDAHPMCEIIAPLAGRILLVPVNSQRTILPRELIPVCRRANPDVEVRECRSLKEALDVAAEDPFVAVTGSLYLIGEAMELLGLSPAGCGERGLNEWSATRPASTKGSKS
ncbi:bifunctional folylpolyglutamate synthase/dihydrofolate synthase [Pedosphaera parvula]|uniref:Dihydrofolate synthase/folylpolyglutamate synthase n=1 Tax=Pedosphaera parvula (strain Ellin514) TaxID=320771 RepID=B9XQF6_PEDPL|nr:folylpolyglutamate synthase/dihydrofolate synthase family protein [Pedosphaera parvula]EEF57980.1 FolC bifunctional protein [Pedosphaera parvula Ellin514]